jgi:hypothetical protein
VKAYELSQAEAERLLRKQAQPVDLKCPECQRTYNIWLQFVSMHTPAISCVCGYRFMQPSDGIKPPEEEA